jgi:hypothetical protein
MKKFGPKFGPNLTIVPSYFSEEIRKTYNIKSFDSLFFSFYYSQDICAQFKLSNYVIGLAGF